MHRVTIIRTRLEEQQELQRLNEQLRIYVQTNRALQLNHERNQVKFFKNYFFPYIFKLHENWTRFIFYDL